MPIEFTARLRMALQYRDLVDAPGDRPLHRLGDEMGDDQDEDREQDSRPPQEQLIAPVSRWGVRLVHA